MGGFFGTIKKTSCVTDLFYGIDYNSHMGTKRAGMATLNDGVYTRAIHNIANSYFRTKFEPELPTFAGYSGIGVISDTDAQPIIVNCHLGKFAIVTVAKITNLPTLERELLAKGNHFCEHSNGITNQSELVSMLIAEGKTFTEGIENVFRQIKGSCSMLILTESGIIAARDKYGRTPIVIGKGSDGYAISSESCAFPNLGYETDYFIGPGEIVLVTADSITQLRKPGDKMQICSFLWVYYGYPVCEYEGRNVDQMRYDCGVEMGKSDKTEADFVSGIPDSGIGMALGYAAGKRIPYKRPQLHTAQPTDARTGRQNETDPEQNVTARPACSFLRRFDRTRHATPRPRGRTVRLRSQRDTHPHQLPAVDLSVQVPQLHRLEIGNGADYAPDDPENGGRRE